MIRLSAHRPWLTVACLSGLISFPSASDAASLRIGGLFSLTGALAAYGPTSQNGAMLAISEINKAGGVLGEEVAFTSLDDQTNPQSGVQAAKTLLHTDKVDAIIGPMSSSVYLAVANSVTIPAQIPLISGSASAAVISSLDSKGFTFRTVPSDTAQAAALADIAHEKGFDSLGVLYMNDAYGKGLADGVAAAFAKLGGKVRGSLPFTSGQISFRSNIEKIARTGPDALMVIAYPGDGQPIVRQALDGGNFNQFLLSDGMKLPNLARDLGAQFLNGTAGTTAFIAPDAPSTKAFLAAYHAAYHQEPNFPYGDSSYDAVMAVALAAEIARSTHGPALRDALHKIADNTGETVGPGDFAKAKHLIAAGKPIHYIGASGTVAFDAHGDVTRPFEHWEIQDGGIQHKRIITPKP